MSLPKLLVFASGSKRSGGSGFKNLVNASHTGTLQAKIVGVVSNHEHGGVREQADRLDIRFFHFPKPWDGVYYQRVASQSGANFFALSGWLKLVKGLDLKTPFNPRTVLNIHPGPLPAFGGEGMYGHHVHKAVLAEYREGDITHSAVCMHFVNPHYDRGPIFFRCPVKIADDDTPETLAKRVNEQEHLHQPRITSLVVNSLITWDGKDPTSLQVPKWYAIDYAG